MKQGDSVFAMMEFKVGNDGVREYARTLTNSEALSIMCKNGLDQISESGREEANEMAQSIVNSCIEYLQGQGEKPETCKSLTVAIGMAVVSRAIELKEEVTG